jgi:carbon monoxide dehydrogenase subunit G
VVFEDTITIDAAAQTVWDFLLDVERSSACVPGVKRVQVVDDRTFDGAIEARVGPIAGEFAFRAEIVESDPPRQLRAEVKGTDSVTKSTVEMSVTIALRALDASTTELAHHADVQVRGRLAILGDMVLRATATLILEDFGKRLRAAVANQEVSS